MTEETKAKVAKWLLTLGFANWFIWMAISISIGGSPGFGWAMEPPYILFNHGATEVSFPVYLYACIHLTISLIGFFLTTCVMIIYFRKKTATGETIGLSKVQSVIILGSFFICIATFALKWSVFD